MQNTIDNIIEEFNKNFGWLAHGDELRTSSKHASHLEDFLRSALKEVQEEEQMKWVVAIEKQRVNEVFHPKLGKLFNSVLDEIRTDGGYPVKYDA
jgi:hypothetical protein